MCLNAPHTPIACTGPPEEVAERVKAEFKYQSGMELSNDTFELVRHVTHAHEIIRHARQRMVQRLNAYSSEHTELFKQVLDLIKDDFLHILQRQALAGKAIIRSNSPLLGTSCPPPRGSCLSLLFRRVQNPRFVLTWCWMCSLSGDTT